ncbi:T9SS type A sorting domain-containing protein [Bacteroidota bacterium]
MIKTTITCIVTFFILANFSAISQDWEWAKIDKSNTDYSLGQNIGIDDEGNTYTSGRYYDIMHIDSFFTYNHYYQNGFVAKFDPNGKCKWLKSIFGNDYVYINGMTVDKSGNSYIIGEFYYDLYIDSLLIDNGNYYSIFFIKIDKNGKVKWASKLDNIYTYQIELDNNDDPHILIESSSDYIYYNDSLIITDFSYNKILKFDKLGNYIDYFVVPDNDYMYDFRFTITNSNKYAMSFHDGNYWRTSISVFQGETELWREDFDEADFYINTIDYDSDDNIYVAGYFYGGINIGGDYIYSTYDYDGLVIKYNSSGDLQWYKHIISYNWEYVNCLTVSNDSILFFAGEFNNAIMIDSVQYVQYQSSIYIVKMSTDGDVRWVQFSDSDDYANIYDITANKDDEPIITGFFRYLLKLGNYTFTSIPYETFFIAKANNKPRMPEKIYGDSIICTGINEYYVDSSSEVRYKWHLSNVGIIENNSKKLTYNFNETGKYKLTVIPYNNKMDGDSLSRWITIKEIPPKPIIAGDTSTCLGTEAYNVDGISENNYNWQLDDGGTLFVINNTALVDWSDVGDYQLSLVVDNFCGSSEETTININVNELPSQPGQITGSQEVCVGTYSYSVPSISGITYSWTISSGGSLYANGNQVTVHWTTEGNHVLSVVPSNSCGTGPARTLAVNVSETPDQPSVIFGDKEVCPGMEIYTINEVADEEYNWAISGGGVIDAEGGRAEVEWLIPGTYTISVSPQNQCGEGQTREEIVEVFGIPEKPDTIYGIINVCQGVQTYSVDKLTNVNYTWALSGGGILTPSQNMAAVEWTDSGTYSITVTPYSICGIGNSKTIIVFVKGQEDQITEINGEDDVCSGEQIYGVQDINGMTYSWELASGGTLLDNNTNVVSVDWTTKGEHVLSLATSDGCMQGKIITVEEIPDQPSSISGDTIVCHGEQLYAISKVIEIEYTWAVSSGGIVTSQYHTANVDWSSSGNHILTVTPSNKCGDGPSRSVDIEVIEKPILPSGFSGDTVACVGENSYSVNDVFGVDFSWSVNGSKLSGEELYTSNIAWNDTGVHVLSIKMNNECGDGPILNKLIEVIDIPEQPLINGSKLVCLGEEKYWIDKKDYENYSWTLNNGGVLTDLDDTAYVIWDSTGTYILTATPTNKCGIGTSKSIQIEVITIPDQISNIVGDVSVCKGIESYEADLNNEIIYNWSLSDGGTLSPLSNSATINWTKAGNYILALTPSNQCGDGLSTYLPIEVSQIPNSLDTIFGSTEVCLGQQTYTIVPEEEVDYSWIVNGGGTISSTNTQATVNWLQKGNYTVKVTPSNHCGLGNSTEKIISIKDIPEKPIYEIADTLVCVGQTIYKVNSATDVNYNWTISGGGTLTSSSSSATVTWNNIGSEIITVRPSNICGNGPSSSLNVEIKNLPTSAGTIIGDSINCLGSKVYSVTSVPTIQYKWELTGGGTLSPFSNIAQISWTSPGDYMLKLAPYNECGYGDTSKLNIIVRDVPTQPGLINGDAYSCVSDTSNYQIVAVGGLSYTWAISSNDLIQYNVSASSVIWSSTGQKTISVKPSNFCGEGPQREVIISIGDVPDEPIFSDGDTATCLGRSQYRVTAVSGTNYIWSLNAGGILNSSSNNCTVDWNTIGDYILSVTGNNSCGSSTTERITIHVQDVPDPVQSITGDTLTCLGKYIYNASNVELFTNYLWSISSGGEINSTTSAVIVEWQVPGTHKLRVVPNNSCGTGELTSVDVHVRDVPPQPNIIIGEDNCCAGSTKNYSVIPAIGASYRWSLTGGGDLSSDNEIAIVDWINQGDHTLTVTPYNICGSGIPRKLAIAIVDQVPQINRDIIGDTIICINNQINYSVPYIEGADYNWNISGNNELVHLNNSVLVKWYETGKYDISVYPESSCGEGNIIDMNVEVVDYIAGVQVVYSGDSIIAISQGEMQWYFNDKIIPFETDYFIKPLEEGDYYVICKNACNEVISETVFYSDSLNIEYEIPAYPNPVHDYLLLHLPVNYTLKVIELIDRNGRIVKTFSGASDDKIRLDFTDVIPGTYYLRLNSELKPVLKKLVVQ